MRLIFMPWSGFFKRKTQMRLISMPRSGIFKRKSQMRLILITSFRIVSCYGSVYMGKAFIFLVPSPKTHATL